MQVVKHANRACQIYEIHMDYHIAGKFSIQAFQGNGLVMTMIKGQLSGLVRQREPEFGPLVYLA